MERIEIHLTDEQYEFLHRNPASRKSAEVGRLAMALAEHHLRARFPGCKFDYEVDGADLTATTADSVIKVEVKGTEKLNNIWAGLVINSEESHGHLLSGVPVYRVTGVYERTPVLYILRHNEDFITTPEPRWRVRRLKMVVNSPLHTKDETVTA